MNRYIIAGLLIFSIITGTYAQTTEPEAPEIVLPDVVLQLEKLPGEESETVVPEETRLYEPEIKTELPDADDLEISDDMVDIPLMDMDTSNVANNSSFYTEGIIGLGLVNHFIGDLTLYKLGLTPRFKLHILHESLDGFHGNEAGTGFFKRTDLLDIQLSHKKPNFKVDTKLNYLEKETGLQEHGTFYSRIQRFYDSSAAFEFNTAGKFNFYLGADVGYLNMDLTGDTSSVLQEFSAEPKAAVEMKGEHSFIRADLFFRYHQYFDNVSDPDDENLKFKLGAGYEFKNGLALSADAGISWNLGSMLMFPFTVNVKGNLGSSGTFKLSGGFEDKIPRYLDLYKINPYLSETGLAAREMNWFVNADTTFKLTQKLFAKVNLDFSSAVNRNIPDYSDIDAATGLYGMTSMDGIFLTAGIGVEYKYSKIFTFNLGWKSQLLEDKDPFFPEHQLDLSSTISAPKDNLGMTVKLLWWINGDVDFPELSLSGFYKISEGIKLLVEGQDILAPMFEDGRILYGNFVEPGVVLTIKTQISL